MVVVSLLATVLIERALAVAAEIEHARVLAVAHAVGSGLMLEAATRLVRGDHAGIAALARASPMDAARVPPPSYAGEVDGLDGAALARGSWYFDRETLRLVYVGYFLSSGAGRESGTLGFRVALRYEDRGADGEFDPGVDVFTGIGLVRDDEGWSR